MPHIINKILHPSGNFLLLIIFREKNFFERQENWLMRQEKKKRDNLEIIEQEELSGYRFVPQTGKNTETRKGRFSYRSAVNFLK